MVGADLPLGARINSSSSSIKSSNCGVSSDVGIRAGVTTTPSGSSSTSISSSSYDAFSSRRVDEAGNHNTQTTTVVAAILLALSLVALIVGLSLNVSQSSAG